MDKGIRPYCNAKFVELNNLRNRGELTNTQFRKNVIADVMEQFGITLASAATHYNHAFKTVKELNSEIVSGLGRAEDKKGGRKPKAKAVETTDAPTMGDVLLSNILAARAGNEGDDAPGTVLLSEGVKENTSTHTVTVNPPATFSVRKVSDGTVVCSDLSLEAANALIEKAAKAKKAKLELVP
jgi:hypothetical protein